MGKYINKFKFRKVVLLLIIISISALLCSCDNKKYELHGPVQATVTWKNYKQGNCSVQMIGETPVLQTDQDQYNVEVEYDGLIMTIDNSELYGEVNTGDKVKVNLYLSEDGKYGYLSCGNTFIVNRNK